jgi:hypothetical protein
MSIVRGKSHVKILHLQCSKVKTQQIPNHKVGTSKIIAIKKKNVEINNSAPSLIFVSKVRN